MARYQLYFNISTSKQARVEVEASSEQEADDLAREKLDYGEVTWEDTDEWGNAELVYFAQDNDNVIDNLENQE
jgi:hypothetical protein